LPERTHLINLAGYLLDSALEPISRGESVRSDTALTASVSDVNLSGLFQAAYLTWVAPSSDGGAPITEYLIDLDDPDGTQQQVSLPPSATNYTFNSLTTGQTYFVFMYAINSAGVSGPGESNDVTLQGRASNSGTVVGIASTADGLGYYLATSGGYVYTFGDAQWYGDKGNQPLNKPIVGIALDNATGGYWLVAGDGGVFNFNAPFYGSTAGQNLNCAMVALAPSYDDNGYYLFACDGGVWNFGDAAFDGSIYSYGNGSAQNWFGSPIVGGGADPQNRGYWEVAENNVVCTYGSVGTQPSGDGWGNYGDWCWYYEVPNGPTDIVGMTPTSDGNGYWLVGADGGVFTAGDAGYFGSLPGENIKPNQPVSGIATPPPGASNHGQGYWLGAQDGGIWNFGQTGFYGSAVSPPPPPPANAWGVDTTSNVQSDSGTTYPQISSTYGTPYFVGRYESISSANPLGTSEASYIHQQGAKILLLYDPTQGSLTGCPLGTSDGQSAVQDAETLGAPSNAGIVVMRDIEASTVVDSNYVTCWIQALQNGGFIAGFYENPYTGSSDFQSAYCDAVNANGNLALESTLWSDQPENWGPVSSSNDYYHAPTFGPATPGCGQNNTEFWQYAEDSNNTSPKVDFDVGSDGGLSELW
jgi:hypothetical protein